MCYLVKVRGNGVFRARFHARRCRAAAPQPGRMARIRAYRRDQHSKEDLASEFQRLPFNFQLRLSWGPTALLVRVHVDSSVSVTCKRPQAPWGTTVSTFYR